MCAIAHGLALWRWWRLSSIEKAARWQLFGWFASSACAGCFFGAVAFAFRMIQLSKWVVAKRTESVNADLVQLYQSGQFSGERFGDYHAAAFFATYSFEFAFAISAFITVLHRVHRLVPNNPHAAPRHWMLSKRAFLTIIVSGACIGAATNIVAAAFYSMAAQGWSRAGAEWSSNSTAAARNHESDARSALQTAVTIGSVQRYIEALLLFIMIVAFAVVGVGSSRIISAALRALLVTEKRLQELPTTARRSSDQALLAQASSQGRRLKRKIVATFIFLFLALLARSSFSFTYALALAFQRTSCEVKTTFVGCGPCKNDFALILGWILFTPEFQQVVMAISSPLALLVALWGMSGVHEFERLPDAQDKLRVARLQDNVQSVVRPAM
jgi:hypothetical protein